MQDVPHPGRQQVEDLLEPSGQRQVDQADQAEEGVQGQQPDQGQHPVVLQHGGQRRALRLVAIAMSAGRSAWALAVGPRRHVPGSGQRRHEDTEPGDPRPPAEVEVVVVPGQPLVQEPGALPGSTRDQHGAGWDVQNLQDPVVLPVVQLPLLQGRIRMPEPIGGTADLAEHARMIPVDHLRADHAHALHTPDALGGLHHPGHGVLGQRRVVVHQKEVVGGLGGGKLQGRSERAGDPPVLAQP
jgi:hypothetical protein